jgi:hypothetical protein
MQHEETRSSGSASHAQAPRWVPNGYASWRPAMDVHLQRAGAKRVHSKVMTAVQWSALEKQVVTWEVEEETAAIALFSLDAAAGAQPVAASSSPPSAKADPAKAEAAAADDAKRKEARKLVVALVERSRNVYGILFAALPEELRALVAHLPQGWAHGLWMWLENKFQSTEEDNVSTLFAEWSNLEQISEPLELFDAYKARVDKIDLLLTQAKEPQSRRQYAYTLLDKLLPSYEPVVLALKVGGQLKDIDKVSWESVAQQVNAYERQKQRAASGEEAKAMAMRGTYAAKAQVGTSVRPSGAGRERYSRPAADQGGAGGSRGGRGPQSLADIQCFRCKKYGHFQRTCPESAPAKESGGSSSGGGAGASQVAASSSSGGDKSRGPRKGTAPRTETVASVQGSNRFDALSSDEEDSGDEEFEASHCGTSAEEPEALPKGDSEKALASKQLREPLSKAKQTSWGVDSMASLHCTGDRKLFSRLHLCRPVRVLAANGGHIWVRERGLVTLAIRTAEGASVRLQLNNVAYHESFSENLISWGVLQAQKWTLHAGPNGSTLTTPGGNVIALRTQGRLSVLETESAAPEVTMSVGSVNTGSVRKLIQLHERLGHIGVDKMAIIVKAGHTLDLAKYNVSPAVWAAASERIKACQACTLGKGTREAFGHKGLDKGSAPGETLHMDTYQVPVHDGNVTRLEYGLVMKDPFTGYRWFAHLLSKDEAAQKVMDIVRNAQTQMECKVKRLYGDGGTEFIKHQLKTFCAVQGIELHYPPARTQQLNGVAERTVRTDKDTARTLLQGGHTPERFWWRAACHGAVLWNRTHISSSTGVTPFESMFKRKPSAKQFGVFGCDSFVHIPKSQRGPMDPTMEAAIYLGHDHVQNCAMFHVLSKKKVVASRDVEFRMDSFAHGIALSQGDDAVNEILRAGYKARDPSDSDSDDEAGLQGGMDSESESSSEEANDVKSILDKREVNGEVQYLVEWQDYPRSQATWEPAANLLNASEFVDEFEAEHRGPNEPPDPAAAAEVADEQESDGDNSEPEAPSAAAIAPAPSPPAAAKVSSRVSRRVRGWGVESEMALSAVSAMQDKCIEQEEEMVCAVTAGVGLLEDQTPQTFREAMKSFDAVKWLAGMDAEMGSCAQKEVWTEVRRDSLPKGTNILPVKWVFKIKTDEHGNVTAYKARITPKGFRQKYGRDFFEVYAATGMYKTMRLGLALSARWDHEVVQMDVPTAFLNAVVDEDVYMEFPEGYGNGKEHLVCKLNKALYGLKQAPRNWYLLVRSFVVETMGFKACVSDPCLFFKRSTSGRLILLFLFVDDFQCSFHRADAAEWLALKAQLVQRFQTKDMGESTWILGMRIQRDRKARTITLDQELYITKALEKYGLAECKAAATPEVVSREAVAGAEADKALDAPCEQQRYMELTGTLMYGSIACRLDCSHAAHQRASKMQAPTRRDMLAAERILRYWSGTRDIGLVFGSRNGGIVGDSRLRSSLQIDVCAYADADWANNKSDRKSITGWVAKVNGDPISWASKKQRTVAQSTCEAELYAEAAAVSEVLWMRGILHELGLHTQMGSVVHGDNQSTIAISKNGVKGERTKHVDVKYHFITETVERGDVQLKWIPTTEQQADIFTKALAAPVFEHFRAQLMTR